VLKPDRNIDHRRVRTLLPYFQQYWRALPALASAAPLLPGDVLFMDTLHGPEPEHMGIVSDRVGRSGLPLIVNNWNDGTRTSEMDLLSFVPVTHRFRAPGRLQVRSEARGLGGLLARRGLTLAGAHRQLVLVTVATWKQSAGVLRRYERQARGGWEPVGEPVQVRVGRRGLGRGRGLHGPEALGDLSSKREGDRKAPAGLFALGTAFGPEPSAPYRGRWPWRAVGSRDRFVDDAASAVYNTWQRAPESGAPAWASAEELAMYELGLVVEHNPEPVQAGAGSAIFIHTWKDPATATLGCTALARDELQALLDWLEPAADPVLVQVAGALL
jgi:L,D-peptidoglycan transpeptidase YkuD (ErfK/YbiS/YcfS/YnhG family)